MERRTFFFAATAAFTLSFAGAAVGLDRAQTAAEARIAAHVVRFEAERTALDTTREALWGETQDGLAWPHYAEALARFRTSTARDDAHRLAAATATGDGADPSLRAELLDTYGPALAHVRLGAHARDGRIVLDWSAGTDLEVPRLFGARCLEDVAVVQLLEARSPDAQLDAIHSILDTQQCAADLAASTSLICEMIGLSGVVPSSLEAHLAEGLADTLDEDAKRAWLEGLRALEARIAPVGHGLFGDGEALARTLRTGVVPEGFGGELCADCDLREAWNAIRFTRDAADHFEFLVEVRPAFEATAARNDGSGLADLRAFHLAWRERDNLLTESCAHIFETATYSRYHARTRLAFLRYALEVHLGEEPSAPLHDYYGTGVDVHTEGGRVRISTAMPETWDGNPIEIVL